jgi:glyoxylase-like metal-dependent hydrolase (beta-lactamase superfamily II)
MLLSGRRTKEVLMLAPTTTRLATAAFAALTLTACSRLSPEMQVVADAAEAMGGADRIQAVRALTMEGSGRDLAVGGSVTPEAPPNVNLVADYRRTLDAAAPRMRTTQTRTAQYRFANAVVVKQDQGLDGEVAYNGAQRASAAAARDRRAEWLRHPLVLVRAALDPAAKVSNLRTEDGQPHVDVALPSGDTVTLAVDPATKLPSHVTAPAYDPNWGDVTIEAQFSNYQAVGGLQLPATIVTKQDQWTTTERTLSSQTLDGDTSGLAAAESVKSAAAPTPAAPTVPVEEVGKGIWWLAGSSHRSVAFEFDDHITLFEVPLDEARTKAVIEMARTLRPGKPVTHAVVSHHHLDHSGGYRTAVAEGLTIITPRIYEAFFKELAGRAHTRELDALARSPKAPMFQLVDDQLELKDGTNTVILYNVETSHMKAALFAWVPRDRTLIQADLFDNGWQQQPWGDTMLEAIAARKLNVATHVPIHGPRQTHAEVLKTLKETPKAPAGGWPFQTGG